MVMAKIFSNDLGFDPTRDSLKTEDGKDFKFLPPYGPSLPEGGFEDTDHVYTAPSSGDRQSVQVEISPTSERLSRLEPFKPWSGEDFRDCVILIKAKGKCTTDHITPAGPWFRYRGHLENISNNTLIGAINADSGKVNSVRNWLNGEDADVPGTARYYKKHGKPWVVIADHNYGEGSSREHAALQPRYLGAAAIIAKSFARIHESNLKKQGLLALTFQDEADYDKIRSSDRINLLGLNELAPHKTVALEVTRSDGASWTSELQHTFTNEEIEYFKAGSALNLMAARLNASHSTE